MSLITRFYGRRKFCVFDPLSLEAPGDWDSFSDFPFPTPWGSSWIESSGRETFAFACPRMDWKETPMAYVFTVDIPRVKKEEVKVEINNDDRVLQISGERSVERGELNGSPGQWEERSCGKFKRRYRLPEDAKVDQVKASINNGVITITVPWVERKQSDIKIIEITD